MKKIIILLSFLFLQSILLVSCSMSGDSVEGRVVEEGSRKPIADVIVVVRWEGYISALVDSQRSCVHVQTTTTDKDGRYKFPAWKKPEKRGPVQKIKPDITVYKTGYQWPDKILGKYNEYYLTPAKGTSGERLAYLNRVAISCSDRREIEINLLPLYKAIYKEAKDLSITKKDKDTVETLLFGLESLKFDSVTALKRMTERRGAGK